MILTWVVAGEGERMGAFQMHLGGRLIELGDWLDMETVIERDPGVCFKKSGGWRCYLLRHG